MLEESSQPTDNTKPLAIVFDCNIYDLLEKYVATVDRIRGLIETEGISTLMPRQVTKLKETVNIAD